MASRRKDRVLLGFHERASHRVVDLVDCLVLVPGLVALLQPLREAMASVLPTGGSAAVSATWTDSGADLLGVCESGLRRQAQEALSTLAIRADLARVSWSRPGKPAEPIMLRRPVRIMLGAVPVDIPPGCFLQPSLQGEGLLRAAVLKAIPSGGPLADLFCGCGAFAVPLCRRGH